MPTAKRFFGLALLVTIALLVSGRAVARAQGPDPEQLQRGAELYAQNCAVCHGAQGEGRVGATLSKDWPSIRPDLDIKTTISNGIPGSVMPAWSQEQGGPLSTADIDALTAYILSWGEGGGAQIIQVPTPTPFPPITPVPEVEGDPNHGALLYGQNCAVCHGPEGEGRVGATLSKDWAGIRPDLNIKTTISNGIPGSVMPAWSQEQGGPLAEGEINDLTAFILSRQDAGVIQAEPEQSPPTSTISIPWLRGWGGVLLFLSLLVVLAAAVIIAQRKSA